MNLMSSKDIGFYWFLCYIAVYWSPFDIVYRILSWHRNPIRIVVRALESIDVVTTCTARVDKAMIYHPISRAAPFLAGFITWVTGSLFRTLEYRGRGDEQIEPQNPPPKMWFATPGAYGGVSRGICFTLAYYWFGKLYARQPLPLATPPQPFPFFRKSRMPRCTEKFSDGIDIRCA